MKLEVEYVGFETLIDHVFDKSEACQEFFSQGKTLNAIIGKNGKFLYVNPQWEKVLGFTVQELTAVPLQTFVHRDDLPKCEAIYKGTKKTVRYRKRDGSFQKIRWITASESENKKYWLATAVPID